MLSMIIAGRGGYLILILKGVPDQDPQSAAKLWFKCGIGHAMNFAEKSVCSANFTDIPFHTARQTIG